MIFKLLNGTGEKIPAIGMGSWNLGMGKEELAALKRGLKLGDKFIDTAEVYGTESLVGGAVEGENGVFIISKVWPAHQSHNGILKACNESLKRLRVKSIDLYLLHWPNYTIPIEETMSAMERLKDEGKIRHIGVSNFSAKEFREAQSCLDHSRIVANEVEYSVIMREPEEELLGFCKKEKITLIAYSPFGVGALFDKKRKPLLAALGEIGEKYNKTAPQIALNWLISKDPVITIPKASSVEHVEENIGAMDFKLSNDDLKKIDVLSKDFQKAPLAGHKALRYVLKHTKFWHGHGAKKLGKSN